MLTCIVATSYLCAHHTDLTPVDHRLMHAETARSFGCFQSLRLSCPPHGQPLMVRELGGGHRA